MKLIYSPDRFIMPKLFHSSSMEVLTNYENMLNFVKASLKEENNLYWDTEKIPK